MNSVKMIFIFMTFVFFRRNTTFQGASALGYYPSFLSLHKP